jgi:nucleotide-binding universal stress UspA family protein
MAAYVKRCSALFGARVSLIHVFDPASHSGLELYVRIPAEIAQEHHDLAREKLDSFLADEFPISECPRILTSGDPARQIAEVARNGGFDIIIMPTYAGIFRRMLLGSTAAKVLNDADCPVLTSTHALTIAPRPPEHREWMCAVGLGESTEGILRFARRITQQVPGRVHLVHAIQGAGPDLPIQLDLEEQLLSEDRRQVRRRIDDLLQKLGLEAAVHIVVGPIKEALLEIARRCDADALLIGRAPQSGAQGRIRDLTYAMVRDSPFPVMSL